MNKPTKKCSKCGKTKPMASFGKRARTEDGYATQCKDCSNAYVRAWHERHPDYHKKQREKNRERRIAQAREYRKRTKEQRAAYKRKHRERDRKINDAYQRKYRKANGERLRARNRKREGRAATTRDWRKANPEKCKLIRQTERVTRRARKLGAFVERVYKRVVWKRDGGVCYLCNATCTKDDWHLDHKIPLCRGGQHSYLNTGIACPSCNLHKGSMTPLEFIKIRSEIEGI